MSAFSTFGSRRGILHVPALAAAAKFAGLAAAKKVAFSRVVQRVGPERALQELRKVNSVLKEEAKRSSLPVGAEVAAAADWSLDTLERSLGALKGEARVQMLWAWYDDLEKRNPTLAAAVLKTYFEQLVPGVKWANMVLKGTPKPAPVEAESGPSAATESTDDDGRIADAIKKLHVAHPEVFDDFHVVLVPKGPHERATRAEDRAARER